MPYNDFISILIFFYFFVKPKVSGEEKDLSEFDPDIQSGPRIAPS